MDDDEVAQILANEARESSVKYSSQGLGAFMPPNRPTSGAPKPNTRFLRHLIRDTDKHNLALKRKDDKEALDRMRQLKDSASSASRSASHTSTKHDRQPGQRESERDRRRERGDRHSSHRERHRSRSASTDRDLSRRHRRHRDSDKRRRARQRPESSKEDRRERTDDRSRRRRERSHSRSRSRSPRRGRSPERHLSQQYHHRSRSPSRSRLRSHETRESRRPKRDEDPITQESFSSRHATATLPGRSSPSRATTRHIATGDESDPLEDLVGPLPPGDNGTVEVPLRSRGRGAYKQNPSSIDAHFAPDYDPTLDLQPDDDNDLSESKGSTRRPVAGLMTAEDDWDMALEALRDRARWKQKGEERLRAAGMNEETVERWKSNPAFTGTVDPEARPEDVRWTKTGEGREWDRGKVMDDEGHIDVRAAW